MLPLLLMRRAGEIFCGSVIYLRYCLIGGGRGEIYLHVLLLRTEIP